MSIYPPPRAVATVATLLAAALAAGCAGPPTAAPAVVSSSTVSGTQPAPPPSATDDHRGGGEHDAGDRGAANPAPPVFPADFPSDIPIPPGILQNASGATGQWSFLLLSSGSAPAVLSSTVALYRAAGFTTESDTSTPVALHRATYTLTALVENRDHSNSSTFLLINISRS